LRRIIPEHIYASWDPDFRAMDIDEMYLDSGEEDTVDTSVAEFG